VFKFSRGAIEQRCGIGKAPSLTSRSGRPAAARASIARKASRSWTRSSCS